MKYDRVGLLVALLLLTSCALLERPYSTHNDGPAGYGAWFALLQNLKLAPERWERKYSALTEETNGAVLIRINQTVAIREDLLAWVREGNILIELESSGAAATQAERTIPVPAILQTHLAQGLNIPATLHGQRQALEKRILTVLETPEEAQQSSLALGTDQDPLLIVQPLGEGIYIYGVIADLAQNRWLSRPQNFQLWTNLLGHYLPESRTPIYVDEVIHGYGPSEVDRSNSAPSWLTYLAASPLALLFWQVGFVGLVWLIGANQRLDLPQPAPTPSRANTQEYINALAATYQRAGAQRLVFTLLFEDFRQQLARKLGVTADDSQLITWAQNARLGESIVDLQTLSQEVRQTTPLTDRDLLARVDLLIQIQRASEENLRH